MASEHHAPVNPVTTVQTVSPVCSMNSMHPQYPLHPQNPVHSINPVYTVHPAYSMNSVYPAQPGTPMHSVPPVQPVYPIQYGYPACPDPYPASPYFIKSYPPVYPPYGSQGRMEPEWRSTLKDHGKEPFVVNIESAAKQNKTFRTALWTGQHFQVTVMSIPAGEDIGLEVHPATDQFICIEEGRALVQMGDSKNNLDFQAVAGEDYAIMIPAGKWHNLTNLDDEPLKLYVIYAPPEHPYGTVHVTKEAAES